MEDFVTGTELDEVFDDVSSAKPKRTPEEKAARKAKRAKKLAKKAKRLQKSDEHIREVVRAELARQA